MRKTQIKANYRCPECFALGRPVYHYKDDYIYFCSNCSTKGNTSRGGNVKRRRVYYRYEPSLDGVVFCKGYYHPTANERSWNNARYGNPNSD